jgi:hypothetical protein
MLIKLSTNIKIDTYLRQLSLESKQKSIIQFISQSIQILNDKIKRNKLKTIKRQKKAYHISW